MIIRPVGHVTEVIGKLDKWRIRRENKNCEVGLLILAIKYLEEYRSNCAELRMHGHQFTTQREEI